MSAEETGQVTGTKDKDYNIIWFTEACLSNALRLEEYIQDAERDGDNELADFFRRAQGASRKGGEEGKQMLAKRPGGCRRPRRLGGRLLVVARARLRHPPVQRRLGAVGD